MTRDKALELGYCKHCAAYGKKGWNCGITLSLPMTEKICIMPEDVRLRFMAERGLEGERKRMVSSTGSFGDRGLMQKPKKRRK